MFYTLSKGACEISTSPHTYSEKVCTLHDTMPSTLMHFGSNKDHCGDAQGVKQDFAVSETLGSTLVVR